MSMRKFCLFLLLLATVVSIQAQNTVLSSRTALTMMQLDEGRGTVDYIQAFVTLSEGVDLKALDAYDVKVNSVVGNMMTVAVSSKRFADFVESGLCAHIEVAKQVYPYLDRTRADLGVDYIYRGINLPQGYDGSGVVVGVIDGGFEYGHPSFFDSTGTTLRIKRVWQQADGSGTAPAGFSYGSEYSTPEQILAAGTDNAYIGHGSHTSGIAAGCGAPDSTGGRYRGMAPAADIVMVACNMTDASIFDGVRYIHQYARSVNKPCVINISLGTVMGPHDGMGPFDTLIVSYLHTVPVDSIVVVVSAGNSGSDMNHLYKSFTATDTVVRTFLRDLSTDDFDAAVDCWGDEGDTFSVTLSLYNLNNWGNHVFHMQLPEVPSTIDSTYYFQLTSPRDTVYDCYFSVVHSSPRNRRPEILITIHNDGRRGSGDLFQLTIKSTGASVHVWSDQEDFFNHQDSNFVNGDYDYLIGGEGGNTDAVITVGSYVTRNAMTDGTILSLSTEGSLSAFSSHGPTYDGRVKPDICAPGEVLVSAVNAPYMAIYPTSYLVDSTFFNGEMHYYVLMQGTSMSSPAVAGIVALWMQQNPGLNVDSVRTLLHTTAFRDRHTGDIPATGNNLWGWGKINAYGGLPAAALPTYMLDVATENFRYGYVTGQGRHPQGSNTIRAVPMEGYAFMEWSDGNTDNPRVVNLTCDTALTAHFGLAPCDTISQFPWEAQFTEGSLGCWDNFGLNEWLVLYGEMYSMVAGRADNWLITPHVRVAPKTSFFYTCYGLAGDSVAIVAITEAQDTVILVREGNEDPDEEHHVDLAAYAGQTVRLGFHHYAFSGIYGMVRLKSVRIESRQGIEEADRGGYTVATFGRRFTIAGAPEEYLTVFDAMGRKVVSSPRANGTFGLPAAGVYVIRIGELPARKIVIVE